MFMNSVLYLKSQALGGHIELSRTSVGSMNVTVKARLLFKCCPVTPISYLKINWGDGSAVDSLPLAAAASGNSPAYYYMSFSGTHVYSLQGVYTITAGNIPFASTFTNIPNSSTQNLVLKGVVNLQAYGSPPYTVFGEFGTGVPCELTHYDDFFLNAGMQNDFWDSLAYSLDLHPELSGYVAPPFGVNPVTGLMTFTANASGDYNVSLRTDAWRKNAAGVYDLITGTSYLELFITVCNIYLPSTTEIIEKAKFENFMAIHPNPTNNIVTVKTDFKGEKHVSLMDATGRLLMNTEQAGEQFNINLSEFTNGVYFLYVRTEAGLLRSKIIKE